MSDTSGMTASQASNLQGAAMATSALSTIGSTVAETGAIKAQGSYLASIARSNAAMANLKATQTLQTGDILASRKNLETKGTAGTARAVAGASGIDVNKGSPVMTQAGITTAGSIDEATIRNNAARSAWGYQTQAMQDTFQAQMEGLTTNAKINQTIATGGLAAISGPLSMYSQSALWQYRYGGRGTPGVPFPSGTATGSAMGSHDTSADDQFWSMVP